MISTSLFSLATLALAAVLPVRGAQFNVTVGGTALEFDPPFVNAAVGDTVVFNFHPKNHTATQSSFANPCSQIPGGFDTGFVPVSVNNTAGPFPAAALTITDENPIWVFCAQTGHCAQGMVFAVNPGTKFDAYKAAALASANSTSSAASSSATASSSASSSSASSTSSVAASTSSAAPATTSTAAPAASTTAAATTSSSSSSYSFVPPSMTASVSIPAATPSATSSDHRVIVGGGVLTFSPSNITAEIGDTVTFEFHTGNHTATASSFASPCVSLGSTSAGNVGAFDSGFMPVASGASTFPTFTIQINNTTPVWAFCKQANHCGQGMVFSVNANEASANNFGAFLANAEKQNGTTSNAGSGTTTTNAAGRMSIGGAGVAFIALATLGAVIGL